MKKIINEEALIVLRKNNNTNQIKIDYVDIENPFDDEMLYLEKICDDAETTLDDLLKFIKEKTVFDKLTNNYRYCTGLNLAYQEFIANNHKSIMELSVAIQNIDNSLKENPENFDENKEIEKVKDRFKNKYEKWIKAYSIRKTYEICKLDKSIIIYSHRTSGFSNPVYQLTPNFSVEIKTNFGYGRSSYFSTKLKYKNIDIIPFSDWINYRFAKFSELMRYTKSHALHNPYWLEAMEFAKDACDLSITDESKFVQKYIIDECEEMAKGLEEFFINKKFTFKNRDKRLFKEDMYGHVLIDFRGEKISGALDFIEKIIEFDKVASIQSFIKRIEKINKKMEPILEAEPKVIKEKLLKLYQEKDVLEPKYKKVDNDFRNYSKKIEGLRKEMIMKGNFDPKQSESYKNLMLAFTDKNPEYEGFMIEYNSITKQYRILTGEIYNHNKILENIISYKEKIHNYFN